MSELLEAFVKIEGTLEEWGGDKELYHAALGHFATGWNGRQAELDALKYKLSVTQEALDNDALYINALRVKFSERRIEINKLRSRLAAAENHAVPFAVLVNENELLKIDLAAAEADVESAREARDAIKSIKKELANGRNVGGDHMAAYLYSEDIADNYLSSHPETK